VSGDVERDAGSESGAPKSTAPAKASGVPATRASRLERAAVWSVSGGREHSATYDDAAEEGRRRRDRGGLLVGRRAGRGRRRARDGRQAQHCVERMRGDEVQQQRREGRDRVGDQRVEVAVQDGQQQHWLQVPVEGGEGRVERRDWEGARGGRFGGHCADYLSHGWLRC
jgi:hypothetical protein